LIGVEVILIASSFSILAIIEGQNVLIGNSINIAGKNRFLSSVSLLEIQAYLTGRAEKQDVDSALNNLEANILALRDGGEIEGVQLSPLRPEFRDSWQQVFDDWLVYRNLVSDITSAAPSSGQSTQELDAASTALVTSSDALVKELGEFSRNESQNLVSLQIALGALNIGVHTFMLYLIVKILKPIRSLRDATAEVKKGNLSVSVDKSSTGELRDLAESFNSMVESLRTSTHELSLSKQKYQAMYDKAPDPYRSINGDGSIVDCNWAYVKSLGFKKKEDVMGHSIFEHTADESLEDMRKSFEEWKRTGAVTNRQVWLKRSDGSTFPASISATSIYDEQTGELIGSNTVIIDESEQYMARKTLEQANEELRNIDKIKDEFINVAAHELRTPVVPIILNAEELAEDLKDDARVSAILRNARRITRLANDILDVSRIESNTFKVNKTSANIVAMIRGAIEDASARIPEGRPLKMVLESKLGSADEENVLVDTGRMEQVLSNLLENSVNFTESGQITVRVERKGQDLQISVSDMGKGIDPTIRDKLFQKFVTKSDRAKGTGLGLYLSKAIVEAHGGSMTAENNADGRGATFLFTLPIKRSD
jgi:PAS domain S-box-containing protein